MRVLQIVHGFPPHGCGGAELYAETLAAQLTPQFGDAVTVIAREAVTDAPEFRVRRETRTNLELFWVNNTFRTSRRFEDTYVNPAITALVAAIVDQVRPDVAHVHHLTCLSTTILDALSERGIPVVLTLHDYWLICHRGQLFDTSLTRCDGPGKTGCARCTGVEGSRPMLLGAARILRPVERVLPSALRAGAREMARHGADVVGSARAAKESSRRRLAHMHDRFGHVSQALAPSCHVRERFLSAGFVQAPIAVSEYGIAAVPPTEGTPRGEPALRVGFAGALMVSKAPHLLADALAMLPPGTVAVEMYGEPAPYHGDTTYTRDLDRRLAHPAITRHGPIAHADMPRVLASLDALVFPSVWEETSGIGAREALAVGVPVIASRIGGIPETVRHDVNGLLFEPGDASDLARQLRRLLDEPDLRRRLASRCATPRTLDDDVSSTRRRYEALVGEATRAAVATSRGSAPHRVGAVVLNYHTPHETALTTEMLRRSETTLSPLIVVDNGDGAECRAALAAFGGDDTVLATGANLGFSGGCNAGIRQALASGADAVLLVNSDVIMPPDCVTRLVATLARQARPGIVAPVVRSRGWPERVLSAGIDYDTSTGRMRQRGDRSDAVAPTAVSGCVMLVHRDVFDRIGLLPEDYFFSFEDIAFCQRARAARFDVGLACDATAYHEGGATMGASPDRLYYAARNHLRLGAQTPSRSSWHRLRRQYAIAAYNVAHAVTADGATAAKRLLAVGLGIADHVRGRYGKR